jgi:hypothetical protein
MGSEREMKTFARSVNQLLAMSQAELDDLFRRSPTGEIPIGDTQGTAVVAPGTVLARPVATLSRLLLWQGKVFDATRNRLRNKITPLSLRLIAAQVYKSPSWLDRRECIVLDYSRASLVAFFIRDEIREVSPGLFLGIVYLGRLKTINFLLSTR